MDTPSSHSPNLASGRFAQLARWLSARAGRVFALSLAVAVLSGAAAAGLELRGGFENLLPPNERSVRELRAIERRAQAFGTVYVVVEANDAAARDGAAEQIASALRQLEGGGLVSRVTTDDSALRQFVWQRRFLFPSAEELERARDRLADELRAARLAANPLYVDLEGDDPVAADSGLAELRDEYERGKRLASDPGLFVSTDGRLRLIVIRTAFAGSSVGAGKRLLAEVSAAIEGARAAFPLVRVGLTGNVPTSLEEHRSILRGMALAAAITVALVALALLWYFRAPFAVAAVLWALLVGTLVTFGVTELAIGHFNVATAFLAAIVVGNGINPNLILLARYFDELRGRSFGVAVDDDDALGRAMAGAARGTLAASLTAAVAYASLIITDFRGFRHFGVIGGVGMVLCWFTAFTVLPASLALLRRRGLIDPRQPPALGAWLERWVPHRSRAGVWAGLAVAAVCAVATWGYVTGEPLEQNWRNLRSHNETLAEIRGWRDAVNGRFERDWGRGRNQRFAVATDSRESARSAVVALLAKDLGVAEGSELFDSVRSLDDLAPVDQERKRATLAEIRALLDDEALDLLDESDRAIAVELRPPAQIHTFGPDEVPLELAWPFTEQDGTRGRIVLVTGSVRFDMWNIRDLVAFATAVRAVELPDDALVGGQAFIFADMLEAMERDGPRASLVAVVGSVLVVMLVFGAGRFAAVTLACAAIGILGMVALVAAFGVKVNFLDFIALPITIGIGIDYAANLAARARDDAGLSPGALLATAGGAVVICSFTTTVGYGSLLLSDNAGIRSFGLAAILGEVACLAAALVLAPALVPASVGRRGDHRA